MKESVRVAHVPLLKKLAISARYLLRSLDVVLLSLGDLFCPFLGSFRLWLPSFAICHQQPKDSYPQLRVLSVVE